MTCLLPGSLDEGLALLAGTPAASPVAGGTELLPRWSLSVGSPDRVLLDLSGIRELRWWRLAPDHLGIGSLTTFWDTIGDRALDAEFPLLRLAAQQVGSPLVQLRGTWGGNIASASPHADGVLALLAYDAVVELRSVRRIRRVALADFQHGRGATCREADELVTALYLPRRPRAHHRFHKVTARQGFGRGLVGLALCRDDLEWRVVVNGVGDLVRRLPTVEQGLAAGFDGATFEAWLPFQVIATQREPH